MKTNIREKTIGLLAAFVLVVAGFCLVPLMATAAEGDSANTTEYTKELDTVAVKVTAPEGAFGEEVDLVVKQLGESESEFAEAEKALAENQQTYDGMLAFDIHFVNAAGEEVEPDGAVSVQMTAKQAAFDGVAPEAVESVQVTHIGDETTVVADSTDAEVEGTVEVQATEAAVEAVDAEFEVDGFSTFTITWTKADGTEGSANVHWGYGDVQSDGSLANEFDAAVLDTTASSVSLANTYEGYYYIGAYYLADGESVGVDIDSVLTKVDNGWETTATIHQEDDETSTTEEHHAIPDGAEIYVIYGSKSEGGYTPSPVNPDEDARPQVAKTVTPNADGTQQIRLEVTAPVKDETHQTGANVLIVFDRTQSMSSYMGTRTRLQVAKDAVATLVDALDCDTNDIQLAFVPFASTGTQTSFSGSYWTSDGDAFVSTVNATGQQQGTNWESGLYYGLQTLSSRDDDATYVIFLTDGEPNRRGTTSSQSANTTTAISYALAQAQAITRLDNVYLYGIFCGSDSGYNNLANMITNAGGVSTINGTNEQAIEDAFDDIAQTIIDQLGSSNYSLDDGIPTLSGVSATEMVTGDVSGFTYEIKGPDDDVFSTWAEAPGASYSADNGVTWDLTEAGTLAEGTTYALEFTVWPSQEAYDLIANLNNGLVDWDSLSDDVKSQINKNGSTYSLKTNTHLNQSYTFNGQSYSEPVEFENGSMPLVSYPMNVLKAWDDSINTRNRTDEVDFYLLVDGKYYQNDGTFASSDENDDPYILETAADAWSDSVQIAPGFATLNEDGTLDVKETGHKYQLEEIPSTDPNYEGYSQEFTTQTVRPMVINGTLTNLVLVDDDNPKPDGATTYTIGEETYFVSATASSSITGTNHKTAELDITKAIDGSLSDKSEEQLSAETFTYEVTFNVPEGGDVTGINYWIYEASESGYTLPEYDSSGLGADYKPYGHQDEAIYNGTKTTIGATSSPVTATVTINRGQIVRFTNLPTGTTYTIVETQANGEALTDQGYTVSSAKSTSGTASQTTIANDTITGEIEAYNTRYYNQFTNQLSSVDQEIKVKKEAVGYTIGDEEYEFTLTAEDAPMPEKTVVKINKDTTDLTESFGSIRFTEAGTYTYTITETNAGTVQGSITYGDAQTVEVTVALVDGKLAVTEITPEDGIATVTNTKETVTVSGTKVWDDAKYSGEAATAEGVDNQYDRKPVTITLNGSDESTYAAELDGAADTTVPTTAAGYEPEAWKYSFVNLPKYADGEEITYTVSEGELEGWTSEVGDDGTVTNTPDEIKIVTEDEVGTSITVKKVDANTKGGLEGAEFTLTPINPAGDTKVFTTNEDGEITIPFPGYTTNEDVDVAKTSTYKLEETKAPTGYVADDTDYTITVTEELVSITRNAENGNVWEWLYDLVADIEVNNFADGVLTVENPPVETEATVKKVWEDANDQDGKRPESLTVTLKNGSETVDTVTLNDGNNWEATIEGLPKYADGEEIEYTWTEGTLPEGYELTDTSVDGTVTTLTNSYSPEETQATVKKVWEDANDQDGKRPESLTVTLSDGQTVTLSDENGWEATITGLPKYASGEEIEYTWTEGTLPEGYELTGTAVAGTVTTLTNTHTPEVTTATVKKVWDDAEDQDGIRPGSLTVTLSDGQAVTLSDENGWEATITGLPKYADGEEIEYTWTEGTLPEGYELTGTSVDGTVTTLTNTHTPEETTATVKKVWDDADNQDGKRPESLTVTLSDGQAVTLSDDNNWEATIEGLPKYADGEEIEYTWTEGTLPEGYTLTGSAVAGTVTTLTNKHVPEKITIDVEKVWEDADNQDGFRPDSVTVNLLAGDEVVDTAELSDENDWKYTWENLDKYADGVEVGYTVEEVKTDVITGEDGAGTYEDTYEGTIAEGYIVTNTHTPETVDVGVKKVWDDDDNRDGKQPESLTVTLSNGDTVNLAASNNWEATIEGLPKYAAGEEISYSWTEASVDGYELTGTSAEGYVTTLTNTHTPELTTVTVTKVWDDADDKDGIRPASITVTLKANGAESGTATLSEDNEWTYTWTDLNKYEAGTEITYTVSEEQVEGYDEPEITGTAAEGYSIKNHHVAKPDAVMSDPPVQKIVEGNPDSAETFTFQLKALTAGAPMPEGASGDVMTMQITGTGSSEFGEMWYTEAGEWKYEITEVKGSAEGYTYDTTAYTLTVKVEEVADGTQVKLAKTETIEGGNGSIVFTNKYEKVIPPTPTPTPKTGDVLPIAGIAIVAIAAAAAAGVAFTRSRRRDKVISARHGR